MAATTKEKFKAAVNVIHSLPKNGAYQPSHAMVLTFYALYKQATSGPCTHSKPVFWDAVGRAKWTAWYKLGNMSQEQAMTLYVDELKKIIETMPHTENVQEFIERLGDFYEIVEDNAPVAQLVRAATPKLQLKLGRVNSSDSAIIPNGSGFLRDSCGNSSNHSYEFPSNMQRAISKEIVETSSSTDGVSWSENMSRNGVPGYCEVPSESGSDADEFCDTVDISHVQNEALVRRIPCQGSQHQYSCSIHTGSGETNSSTEQTNVTSPDQLTIALHRLQTDMGSTLVRLQAMETLFLAQKKILERDQKNLHKPSKWELFSGINYPTIAFLVAWPVVAHFTLHYLNRKRT